MDMISGSAQLVTGVPSSDTWSQSGEVANVGELKFFKNKNGATAAGAIVDPHKEVSEERFFASDNDIPDVGDTYSVMGQSVVITEARKIYSNEDAARVRLTGRTITFAS